MTTVTANWLPANPVPVGTVAPGTWFRDTPTASEPWIRTDTENAGTFLCVNPVSGGTRYLASDAGVHPADTVDIAIR